MTLSYDVEIPEDEEFRKELKAALSKPEEWYLERVDRAVRRATRVKRRPVRVQSKA